MLSTPIKSWAIPQFDIKDPSLVFYAPLWRPDMVARCGDITDGTGTLTAGSPLILAVGANTVDVAVAGTFIVRMPEGGTVTTGTMTVTGSTVTIPAGIATTITTTGAIGNITCTPSNIIRSKDSSNTTCTITGTTWGSQGRSFDIVDDNVNIPHAASLNITGNLTILMWFKPTDFLSHHELLSKYNVTGTDIPYDFRWLSTGAIQFGHGTAVSEPFYSSTSTPTTSGIFYYLGLTRDGSTIKHYIGGSLDRSQVQNETPTPNNLDVRLGLRNSDDFALANGVMGDVLIYNRDLSAAEIQNLYLVTKWRYL